MASNDTNTVLDEANARAVALMLDKLEDHDVTVIYETVGGVGPIADLAADAMKNRNIDLQSVRATSLPTSKPRVTYAVL